MLFTNEMLQSNFDIGQNLSDEQANFNFLADEIIRITEKIYNIEGKIVWRNKANTCKKW